MAELEHVTSHGSDKGMFVRTCRQVEHGIEPVYPELVPDHAPGWRAGSGIPDGPIVGYSLHCGNGCRGDSLAGYTGRNDRPWREVPADPWRERTAGLLERVKDHNGNRCG